MIGEAVQFPSRRTPSTWSAFLLALYRISRCRSALIGLIIVTLYVFLATVGPAIAPHPYDKVNLAKTMVPPFWASGSDLDYLLGTDALGRDLLSRIVYGARIAMLLGGTVTVLASGFGLFMGAVSGYFGGLVDKIIMRLVDIQWSFPSILLALAVMALLGSSMLNLILVLLLTNWVSYARTIRQVVLSLREEEFVTAARSLGASDISILIWHILPNVAAPMLVLATFNLASIIMLEATLSFVGLGVQPPTPTWGGMISISREYLYTAWWQVTFPGVALMVLVLGVNQLGDGLRDLLDPRLRGVL